MENAGLVTLSYSFYLLADDDRLTEPTQSFKRYCSFELAHMWYGQFCHDGFGGTTFWLNEAFASGWL